MISELLVLASLMSSLNTPAVSPAVLPNIITIQEDESPQGPKCIPRKKLIENIKRHAAAVPLFVGIGESVALEVWQDNSSRGNMWISFLTRQDGMSCLLMQGNGLGLADPNIQPPSSQEDRHS